MLIRWVGHLAWVFLPSCTDRDPKKANIGKPVLKFSIDRSVCDSNGIVHLDWNAINSNVCQASGNWSGRKELKGRESFAAKANSIYTLSCFGTTVSTSKTLKVASKDINPAIPQIKISATFLTVDSGGKTTLTWSAEDAISCRAEGGWSGPKSPKGSEFTPSLNANRTFILSCKNQAGFAKDSITVVVASPLSYPTGLCFPSNGETSDDIRFSFTGEALLPMYPASYIWKVNLRRQAGFYTTFFWGPNGPFTGASYYGCHPYPDGNPKPASRSH